jgi:hypothetical protein
MESNPRKVFTNKVISIVSFFGGPIAAGFLIAKNYKAFGNDNAALNSIFIGIISTILMFTGLYMLPERISDSIPQTLIPTLYTAIIAALVEKLQGQKIKDFLNNNGQKASNWHAAGFGFLGLFIIAGFLGIMIFGIPMKDYEKSITIDNNIILYYSKTIDEPKSQLIARAIKQSRFLQGTEGADLFLSGTIDYIKNSGIEKDIKLVLIDNQTYEEYPLNI